MEIEDSIATQDWHAELGKSRGTPEPPDYDDVITNWTDYCHGGSPHYLGVYTPDRLQPVFTLTAGTQTKEPLPDPQRSADVIAHQLLCMGEVHYSEILCWVDALRDAPADGKRARERINEGGDPMLFQTGAFVFGGNAGLFKNTLEFPWSSLLLATIISSLVPGHLFSSAAISCDVQTPVHRDQHNHRKLHSIIIPASRWETGGELWTADPDGSIELDGRQGAAYSLHPYRLFDSTKDHGTLPWTGTRIVILGWHIRQGWRLSYDPRQTLLNLRYPIWSSEVLTDPYLSE
ncbi:unnamed protein product [Symbiodinium sp. CCMP2592]|nr:unnamed protein product [Symbiodinium sp. CCMP2592]